MLIKMKDGHVAGAGHRGAARTEPAGSLSRAQPHPRCWLAPRGLGEGPRETARCTRWPLLAAGKKPGQLKRGDTFPPEHLVGSSPFVTGALPFGSCGSKSLLGQSLCSGPSKERPIDCPTSVPRHTGGVKMHVRWVTRPGCHLSMRGPGVRACVRARGSAQPRSQSQAGGPQGASGERRFQVDCTACILRGCPSRTGPQGLASPGDSASHIQSEAGQGPTWREKWPQLPLVEGPSQQSRHVAGGRQRRWVGG